MATIVFPLLVAVAGALLYALPANATLRDMGRIAFAVGLLWTVYIGSRVAVHLG